MMDGRVKALHPKGPWRPARACATMRPIAPPMEAHAIGPIDIVVSESLSLRRPPVANGGRAAPRFIENIDIGGPAMIRSPARRSTKSVDGLLSRSVRLMLRTIAGHAAQMPARRRWRCALGVAAGAPMPPTATPYDGMIDAAGSPSPTRASKWLTTSFPSLWPLARELRYGENPHPEGRASTRHRPRPRRRPGPKQVQGKELSYNN